MPETRKERKHRDLRLADSMEQHLADLQELVAEYAAAGGTVPEGWAEGQFAQTRSLIALLRGEEPNSQDKEV